MNTCQTEPDPVDGVVFVCEFTSKHLNVRYRVAPRIVDVMENDDRHIELAVDHVETVNGEQTKCGVATPVMTIPAARELAKRLLELADQAEAG